MISILKSVRCLFGYHGDRLLEHDALICLECGQSQKLLEGEIVKDGIAHRPAEVRGAPKETKVKIHAERSKIRAFR